MYNFRRFFSQTDNDGDTLLAFDPPIDDVGGATTLAPGTEGGQFPNNIAQNYSLDNYSVTNVQEGCLSPTVTTISLSKRHETTFSRKPAFEFHVRSFCFFLVR